MERRELRVAEILLEHWDPLFVADTDVSPESEYLFEAAALLDLLDSNSELAELRSYLASSSKELNPSTDTARIDTAAQAVWDFYWSSEEWATRQPPLIQAALRRDLAAITELIAASVSPGQATPEGFSALHAAASRAFDDVGRRVVSSRSRSVADRRRSGRQLGRTGRSVATRIGSQVELSRHG